MADPEVWLRGPVAGVAPALMPAAHAVLQAKEDAARAVEGLSVEQVWLRPGGAASVGFHLIHFIGALDRLYTYARGEPLTAAQRASMAQESQAAGLDAAALLALVDRGVTAALERLRATPEASLADPRGVGRAQLPSTVLGLLFHGAEHATRHAGQAITTAKIVAGLGLK